MIHTQMHTYTQQESPPKETTVKPQTSAIPKLLELDVKQPVDTASTNHNSARSPEAEKTTTILNEPKGSEDGEIFSDDEEAAYYPQHVKSRPRPQEKKVSSDATKQFDTESQKSDTESLSGVRSGRRSRDRYERERNLRSSPESESDSTYQQNRTQASDSKEQGLFFEDRDGSETESTGSRERARSRSRERDRDRHSSPKYGGSRNRNRERDRDRDRGNRTRNDDDSSDDKEQQYRSSGSSTYYGRQSGVVYGGRTRGGYGGYQQRGGYGASKFQVGGASGAGGGGGGGYTSSVQPGLMNTGMTPQQFHALAAKVKKRREDGLPLLPQPNLDKCGNLDQYNYPAPPSWYLEELEAWEKREKEREEEEMMKKKGAVMKSTEQATKPQAEESKTEVVTERRRPISPLFRRTSSVALEIVSSPVSDDDPSLEVMEDGSELGDKSTEPASSEGARDTQLETEPMETAPESSTESVGPAALANDSAGSTTAGVKPLKELAKIVVEANSTKPPSPTATTTTMATTAIATSVMTTTESIAMTTTIAITTTGSSTAESAPQSLPNDPSTSTATPPQSPPTSDSAHLPEKAPPTKPTPAPLTISTDPDSDHSHSPSLSPTIPIQSGSQMKGAPSSRPKGVFRPKIMSDSDSEEDYDDYLDQLDKEEDDVIDTKNSTSLLANTLSEGFPLIGGSSAPSLTSLFEAGDKAEDVSNQILGSVGDPFSEDFPTIGKGADKSSTKQNSLMSLIAGGQEVVDKDTDKTQG